jgi:hypothetical protein
MHNQTIDDWLNAAHAELIGSTNAMLKLTEGPQPWYVVRFKPGS